MKRPLPVMVLALCCSVCAMTRAADPSEAMAKNAQLLKDRGVMPFAEKAAGFVNLVARLDIPRIEKLYGCSDQMREILSAPELAEALKSVDNSFPFSMDLVAFDILDTQTCSLLFVIHGSSGPIGIKVYMQPVKDVLVHRVEVILDWEELEKLAHRMEKLPVGYTMTQNHLQEDRP